MRGMLFIRYSGLVLVLFLLSLFAGCGGGGGGGGSKGGGEDTGSNPTASITAPSGNTIISAGKVVSFHGTASGGDGQLTYAWNFPGGTPGSSAEQNPGDVQFNTAGTFTCTLTVTDADGDTGTDTVTVTVGGLDSDGDGVANDLEVNGYTFDEKSGTFVAWNGDPSVPHFKTDPKAYSTDGDHYSDGMEASGVEMDRSVKAPGNHPLIAAYPNFTVKLIHYYAELNSLITETDGTTHGNETNWHTDTYDTTATTHEEKTSASYEVAYSLTKIEGKLNLTHEESSSRTRTTGTVSSGGGNVMDSSQWSLATCSTTTDAARIWLTLQVENVGTCAARDITFNMNLYIGEELVQSIPLRNSISCLVPGVPHEPGVEGGNGTGIPLTFSQLKLLETGAPVSIVVTDVKADVVRKEITEGVEVWKAVNSWDNYMLEISSICAQVYLDLGDGNTTEQLVYAGGSPVVAMRDAITWAANGQDDPDLGPVVRFYQPGGALGTAMPLNGWYFSLDSATYAGIESYIQNPGFNLFDTVLKPGTVIVAKAPPIDEWPRIQWGLLSPQKGQVRAYADDYFFSNPSFLTLFFMDKFGVEHPMDWNADDLFFFCLISNDYYMGGNEEIVAHNAMYHEENPDLWEARMSASEMGYLPRCYLAGSCDTELEIYGLSVSGNYAYVTNGEAGQLQVYDISDPANLVLVGSSYMPDYSGMARGVYVSGNYAYVAAYSAGLAVYDISDPTNPILLGSCDTPGDAVRVFVSGNYAYVADGYSGLQVFNISTPANPTLVGSFGMSGYANGVYVSGNYAYVTNYFSGLQVINVSNPAHPGPAASYNMPEGVYGVYVSGNYAYVAYGTGLQVIDITSPASPILKGSYDTPGSARGVYVSGDLAYVADGESGLQMINISDPASPRWAGSFNTPRAAVEVCVSGGYVYTGWSLEGTCGLYVIGYR
jgi:hypothetical protein